MFLTGQDGNIKYDKLQLNCTQTTYSYIFGAISLLSQRKKNEWKAAGGNLQ